MGFDIPVIAELLVAGGTLTLAGMTYWLAWNSRKERKTREARELAIGAYNPLHVEVSNWTNLESAYNGSSHQVWSSLNLNQLDLVARIPPPISSKLETAEKLVDRVKLLGFRVSKEIIVNKQKWANELYPQRHPPDADVDLRLTIAGLYVGGLDPIYAWLSRKTLSDYLNDYVAKRSPSESWGVQLHVGSAIFGDIKDAEAYSKKLFNFLDSYEDAKTLRDLHDKLSAEAIVINSAIEKELRKH